jgi:hypothetical protein
MDDPIIPNDLPELFWLCWNRDRASPLERDIAFGLYRREWWSVDQDKLTVKERDLIMSLEAEFGVKLLGTSGQRWNAPDESEKGPL